MKEAQFRNIVITFLRNLGGHFEFMSACDTKKPNYLIGSQDIIGCLKGKYIRVETKVKNNKPTKIQLLRQEQVRNAGGLSYVVRPENFTMWKAIIMDLFLGEELKGIKND